MKVKVFELMMLIGILTYIWSKCTYGGSQCHEGFRQVGVSANGVLLPRRYWGRGSLGF